jgi:hypothetical protein
MVSLFVQTVQSRSCSAVLVLVLNPSVSPGVCVLLGGSRVDVVCGVVQTFLVALGLLAFFFAAMASMMGWEGRSEDMYVRSGK